MSENKAYRCWRLGSWKILAGMEDRRLRFSRRTCRLLDRLVKQPVSSAEIRLLLRNLRVNKVYVLIHLALFPRIKHTRV